MQNIQEILNNFKEGKFDIAEKAISELIKQNPNRVILYNILGMILLSQKKIQESINCYNQAIKINPNDADIYNNLGIALWKAGLAEESVVSFKKNLAIKPHNAQAYYNMGMALFDIGRINEAKKCFIRAVKLKPDYAIAYFSRYPIFLDFNDLSSAIKAVKDAIKLKPKRNFIRMKIHLGMLLEFSGKIKESKKYFEKQNIKLSRDLAILDACEYMRSIDKKKIKFVGSSNKIFQLSINECLKSGLFLEFGVRFGNSIRQISKLVKKQVYGFDSFMGLPEAWGDKPKGSYSTRGFIPSVPSNVTLYKGLFDKTLPNFLSLHKQQVCFINIDCDTYSSTKIILDLLSSRIRKGTVIVFDEYIGNVKWREHEFKAFQEAVKKYRWKYKYIAFSLFTQQVVVKIV